MRSCIFDNTDVYFILSLFLSLALVFFFLSFHWFNIACVHLHNNNTNFTSFIFFLSFRFYFFFCFILSSPLLLQLLLLKPKNNQQTSHTDYVTSFKRHYFLSYIMIFFFSSVCFRFITISWFLFQMLCNISDSLSFFLSCIYFLKELRSVYKQ